MGMKKYLSDKRGHKTQESSRSGIGRGIEDDVHAEEHKHTNFEEVIFVEVFGVEIPRDWNFFIQLI